MATPKKPTPKVKITGSASGRVATGTKSVTRGGSMAQNAKIVDRKPAASTKKVAKGPTIAGPAPKISILKGKADRANLAKRGASGNLMLVKEAKKLGNLQGPGSAARRMKQAVQSDLEAGKTAARGKIQLMNAKKSKAAKASAKTTVYKPKQASAGQQVAKAAGKVIGRAKSVAREVRDIPTAVAGAGKAFGKASQKGNVGGAAGKARGSVTNIGKQFVEIGKTAVTGKKGTTAAGKKRK